MREQAVKKEPYSNENHRFRRAYIKERLGEISVEREKLIAERLNIDQRLGAGKKAPVDLRTPQEPALAQ